MFLKACFILLYQLFKENFKIEFRGWWNFLIWGCV